MLGDISVLDKVYIVCGRTDMRKQIDGLCAIIEEQLKMNTNDNCLFLFCGRKKDRIKALTEMKRILDYIDGKGASDEYTKQLEEAVRSARQNESWRLGYMTLEYEYRQRYEEGLKEGKEAGKEEGLKEGEETGIAKTNERSIRKLYERGESIASIAEFVELDEEAVKRIIEAMGLE